MTTKGSEQSFDSLAWSPSTNIQLNDSSADKLVINRMSAPDCKRLENSSTNQNRQSLFISLNRECPFDPDRAELRLVERAPDLIF